METGKTGRGMALSERLGMLADMVTPGSRVADIGCDHGFLSIYLVRKGICPAALAMDVREGPLAGARQHVSACGLSEYIAIRRSDGLEACGAAEADALVCAGMGGRLMERILRQGMDKVRGMRELILQPQSELPRFRAFLRETGLTVVREDAVCEEGKYYFAMKAVWEGIPEKAGKLPPPELSDRFGGLLLAGGHPVLLSWLREREAHLLRLAESLNAAASPKAGERLAETLAELSLVREALAFAGDGR